MSRSNSADTFLLGVAGLLAGALMLLAGYAGDELRKMRERAETAERHAAATEARLQRSGERAMQCVMLLDVCCDGVALDYTGGITATPRSPK